MGRALWKLGDSYKAMWKYEEALSLNNTLSVGEDLEEVIISTSCYIMIALIYTVSTT